LFLQSTAYEVRNFLISVAIVVTRRHFLRSALWASWALSLSGHPDHGGKITLDRRSCSSDQPSSKAEQALSSK